MIQRILLTAALGLLTGAIAVWTANAQPVTPPVAKVTNIKISALPFNITVPGTYVFTGNLVCGNGGTGDIAITISNVIGGPVVLDLKRYTLDGGEGSASGVIVNSVLNPTPITIRNGKSVRFYYGCLAFGTSEVNINNILFDSNSVAVGFTSQSSPSVNNCIFQKTLAGYANVSCIEDAFSNGGNSYKNDKFINMRSTLVTESTGQNGTIRLGHCQFAPPPSN